MDKVKYRGRNYILKSQPRFEKTYADTYSLYVAEAEAKGCPYVLFWLVHTDLEPHSGNVISAKRVGGFDATSKTGERYLSHWIDHLRDELDLWDKHVHVFNTRRDDISVVKVGIVDESIRKEKYNEECREFELDNARRKAYNESKRGSANPRYLMLKEKPTYTPLVPYRATSCDRWYILPGNLWIRKGSSKFKVISDAVELSSQITDEAVKAIEAIVAYEVRGEELSALPHINRRQGK